MFMMIPASYSVLLGFSNYARQRWLMKRELVSTASQVGSQRLGERSTEYRGYSVGLHILLAQRSGQKSRCPAIPGMLLTWGVDRRRNVLQLHLFTASSKRYSVGSVP
ncbi:uncharacterized protein CIMG_13674 [Coccidioides immitis RS]|uniref:Uncharacterized protein n=1 Tax=Coccidioides immitis (strain RS) TaxID=246410 RepID=A0A0D8JYV3_COCIM|nr:uncharacterized protein CIMG_13674 [Coccidioides immitis RS]KJF61443.1 hypothetical protein CIMG_13674 [Coccidioides immitis RS]